MLIVYAVIQTAYFPFLMYLDGKLNLKSILSFIVFPFYSLTWIPVAILGIIHKDSKEWVHTKHVRSLDLKQVEEKIVKRKEML